MTGWRHVEEVTLHAGSRVCGQCYVANNVCTTPTPDPASPCLDDHEPQEDRHVRVPTCCTCGHPIKRVP